MRLTITAPPDLAPANDDASPFVAACLLPAMRGGEDLEIDGPVSPLLMRGAARARSLYVAWDRRLRAGEVRAAEEGVPRGGAGGIGCFFSRGVDSTYSAAAPRALPGDLTGLVFVDGLEPRHDAAVRAREIELSQQVAARIGLPLAVAHTNLREFADRFVPGDWEDMVGAGLASLATALGGGFAHVVVPATYGSVALGPCGTSPLLDPLFSTEAVAVHHDSVARGRVAKVLWLARHWPDLARGLKVCFYENRPDNCGRCGKCLHTMACLEAAGVLGEAEYFPHEIPASALAERPLNDLTVRIDYAELHDALDPVRHRDLRDAILTALARPSPHPALPAPQTYPGFRATHNALVFSLVRDGLPLGDRSEPGLPPVTGLVRTVDPARRRHLYGLGSVPEGELVGELGGLLNAPGPGSIALWTTPEGYLVTREQPRAPARSRQTTLRWLLGPLFWRDLPLRPDRRLAATLSRCLRLALGSRATSGDRLSPPSGPAVGHLHASDGAGRVPLYSALHPVTGDQLLTTGRWEAIDLGYGEPLRLGYLEARAPLTGTLDRASPMLPWASRFGRRMR